MSDYNVFAVLTSYNESESAEDALRLPHNQNRFREGIRSSATKPTIDSREPTPGPTEPSESENKAKKEPDRIFLTFDDEVKDPESMWQFGTRPSTSDILLGRRGIEQISAKQFNIVIDDKLGIWLHDYHSSFGTGVGYSGQKKDEVRRKETWILCYGPGIGTDLKDITIHIGPVELGIEFPNHRAAHPKYIKNLRTFLKKCRKAAPPVEGLDLNSDPPTQKPSQIHTPSTQPIYLDNKVIGRGAFGEVRKIIKLRDGKFYAAKYFFPPKSKGSEKSDRKRKQDKIDEIDEAWLDRIQREYNVMRDNPHVSTLYLCL